MPPFTYYQPVMINTQQPEKSSDSFNLSPTKKAQNDVEHKDLFKMLQDLGGLKSDREEIFKTIELFFREDSLGLSTSSLSTIYLRALNQMITAKNNQEEYKNAYQAAQKNESLSEIAINSTGHVIVADVNDSNRIPFPITPQEYIKNKHQYVGITNLELLRKRDEELPFNNKLFDIVMNGTSLPHIDKLISQYAAQLGSDTYSDVGYIRTQQGQVAQGLEYLQEAGLKAQKQNKSLNLKGLSIEGLYKAKLLTKDQAIQAQRSISYILRMLPQNAKSLLMVKSGSEQGVIDLITNMILRTVDNTFDLSFDLEEEGNDKKSGSSGGSEGNLSLTPTQMMVLDYGYSEPIVLNIGTSYQFTGRGLHNTLQTKDGTPLVIGDSLKDVSGSQQSSVLDFDHATFGGSRLNDLALDWSAIKSNNMIVVDLPYKISANGAKQPNLELLSKLEVIDDLMKKRNISDDDYASINQLYIQQGLPPKYVSKSDGWVINSHDYLRFGVIYTNLDERALVDKDSVNENLVNVVTDDSLLEQFTTLIQKKTNNKDYELESGILERDKIYQGPVFIPIKNDFIQASQSVPEGSRLKISGNNIQDIYTKQAINEQVVALKKKYNTPPPLSTLN